MLATTLRTSDEQRAQERLRARLVALDQQVQRMHVKPESRRAVGTD